MAARSTLAGEQLALGGFLAVNREKLKALPLATLGELARSEELELLYLHLQSLRRIEALRQRLPLLRVAAEQVFAQDEPGLPTVQGMTVH